MSTQISLTIKTKREILEKYYSDEYDFSRSAAAPDEEMEIELCGLIYLLDQAEKMVKENPMEHIYMETHAIDVYAYSGEHYYEQRNGEVKEWSDTSGVEEVYKTMTEEDGGDDGDATGYSEIEGITF